MYLVAPSDSLFLIDPLSFLIIFGSGFLVPLDLNLFIISSYSFLIFSGNIS